MRIDPPLRFGQETYELVGYGPRSTRFTLRGGRVVPADFPPKTPAPWTTRPRRKDRPPAQGYSPEYKEKRERRALSPVMHFPREITEYDKTYTRKYWVYRYIKKFGANPLWKTRPEVRTTHAPKWYREKRFKKKHRKVCRKEKAVDNINRREITLTQPAIEGPKGDASHDHEPA